MAFAVGSVVGSFLNVVIWRMPRGLSVVSPGSHCPHCDRPLAWWENVPLVSFLALRARCRTCREPIRWRYFWVELLTAGLFAGLIRLFGATADGLAYCVFAAALVVALGVDLEHYIIPDGVNTLALLVGIGRDMWGIGTGEPAHRLLWGWLPRSVAGAALCAALFVAVQALGLALFRKDAMGDGDVKLARAIGAMLPLPLALVSFLFAVGAGAVIGGAMCIVRGRKGGAAAGDGAEPGVDEEDAAPPPTPWRLLAVGGALYVTFGDLVIEAANALGARWARRFVHWWDSQAQEDGDEAQDFVPMPTQVPFGPFMVIGAFLALVAGRPAIDWYLAWAGFMPGT
jgi:leader peptidase (prepilin peptidase)/N-methyltransferase